MLYRTLIDALLEVMTLFIFLIWNFQPDVSVWHAKQHAFWGYETVFFLGMDSIYRTSLTFLLHADWNPFWDRHVSFCLWFSLSLSHSLSLSLSLSLSCSFYLSLSVLSDMVPHTDQKQIVTTKKKAQMGTMMYDACRTGKTSKRDVYSAVFGVAFFWESCYAYGWIMLHIWMSHVTRMNESCHTKHVWMCHFTHIVALLTWLSKARVAWVIHMCDMTHLFVWSHIFMSDLTHSYVWHDSFLCRTGLSPVCPMGWLRSVGFIKWWVSFAEYRLFYGALLQKRPII